MPCAATNPTFPSPLFSILSPTFSAASCLPPNLEKPGKARSGELQRSMAQRDLHGPPPAKWGAMCGQEGPTALTPALSFIQSASAGSASHGDTHDPGSLSGPSSEMLATHPLAGSQAWHRVQSFLSWGQAGCHLCCHPSAFHRPLRPPHSPLWACLECCLYQELQEWFVGYRQCGVAGVPKPRTVGCRLR